MKPNANHAATLTEAHMHNATATADIFAGGAYPHTERPTHARAAWLPVLRYLTRKETNPHRPQP